MKHAPGLTPAAVFEKLATIQMVEVWIPMVDVLAAAIECLERLAAGRARKRGRPPKWLGERGEGGQPGNATAPEHACEKSA